METKKIVNLLNGSDKTQNLQHKNGMLLTLKQKVIIQTKMKANL